MKPVRWTGAPIRIGFEACAVTPGTVTTRPRTSINDSNTSTERRRVITRLLRPAIPAAGGKHGYGAAEHAAAAKPSETGSARPHRSLPRFVRPSAGAP